MITVGYIHDAYPEIRCIINKINDKEVIYKKLKNSYKKRDLYRVMKKLHLKKVNPYINVFKTKDKTIDLIHTFNYICYTKKTWITTFETILPRRYETMHYHHENRKYEISQGVKKDIRAIASDSCKKIIALSECNKRIQEDFLNNFEQDIARKILDKMIVIHPPQKLMITEKELDNKLNSLNNEVKFLFVGNQFFRKGGIQILNVLNKIRKKSDIKVKLIIVTKFSTDKEFTRTIEQDRKKAIDFVNENREWIVWYENIENSEVLKIAKECNVGLLPTIADTYGYSVLEMQASGLPVITTNVRALSEINNNSCGWICKIPTNHYGEALYSNEDSMKKTQQIIEEELERNIMDIIENPGKIKEKGKKAWERIKKFHNPQDYANKLYNIYKESINLTEG